MPTKYSKELLVNGKKHRGIIMRKKYIYFAKGILFKNHFTETRIRARGVWETVKAIPGASKKNFSLRSDFREPIHCFILYFL